MRLDTIEELRANGRLDVPLYKKPEPKAKPKEATGTCCIDKYGGNLPQSFKPCIDCERKP
jgi:hypothetical protein